MFTFLVAQDYRMSTIYGVITRFSHVSETEISELLCISPMEIRSWWKLARSRSYQPKVYDSFKLLLKFLCSNHINGWSPTYLEFLSVGLPHPSTDKYASVRIGDVFLATEEEAAIVHHLDKLASSLIFDSTQVEDINLVRAGPLLCSYLFAMRPIQIANLKFRDVRIWNDSGEIVHLTFSMAKQRSKSKSFPITRRVKQDWTPIIVEIYKRGVNKGLKGEDRLFGINSAQEMSNLIINIASEVTGSDISATDLRHTAAQRLVDAGASQEEVAEFLAHSDITTCLVYYRASANQSELVNKALGISEIYRRVARIAHDRFISPDELAELKSDQQIAGAPHGIPIHGIGGCATGQPTCSFNPITSCYGCHKFMPVTDIDLHRRVLEDMRSVVIFFSSASNGESHSPAYMQLRRTIASIQQVITELEVTANA